jgi:hypothetical protein
MIVEIGDVSKEEALQYLKLRKIDDGQAAQIYELVGGRMIHLKRAADEIQDKSTLQGMLCSVIYRKSNLFLTTFTDVRKNMFRDAQSQLTLAKILPHDRYHESGAMIIRELVKKGSISYDTYFDLVGREAGNRLLETNVFAHHFDSDQITFQSTLMARFCEQKFAYWKKN